MYSQKKRTIPLSSESLELLRSLAFAGCEPLLAFPEEGQAFESTDVLWVMDFINAKIVAEGMNGDELNAYGICLQALRNEIRRNCARVLPEGYLYRELEDRTLETPAGIYFSKLGDNWRMDFFLDNDVWGKREIYRCHRYGDLPDGRHYGAHLFPYRELDEYSTHIRIVEPTGESHILAYAGPDHHYPKALAATPDGNMLAWIYEDSLMVWRKGETEFESDGSFSLSERLEDRRIKDAVIRRDGILEILFEDGTSAEYRHDTDEIVFL